MTSQSARALPNTFATLGFAIASAIALSFAASGSNGVMGVAILIAGLGALVLSTRSTIRNYRRLSTEPIGPTQFVRWVPLSLALMINGIIWLMVVGYSFVVVGIFVTGRGITG